MPSKKVATAVENLKNVLLREMQSLLDKAVNQDDMKTLMSFISFFLKQQKSLLKRYAPEVCMDDLPF
ncbi:hypothetical protein FACS1894211_16800 [Clostridia bacterium]|nr:hypothetical protein FACS1894211_16800 [Clostridia bacterium]